VKRTFEELPKPDIYKSYRHAGCRVVVDQFEFPFLAGGEWRVWATETEERHPRRMASHRVPSWVGGARRKDRDFVATRNS